MPVILGAEHYSWWLEPKFEPEFLKTLLRPFPANLMDCRQVSSVVNNARNDGPECIGQSSDRVTITNVSNSDAANYTVIVNNAVGIITSFDATLTVIDPPVITAQPANLLVLAGTNLVFGVSLTGSASFFNYQWQLNGTSLPNATTSSYTIPSVGTNDAGNYSVWRAKPRTTGRT